MDLLLFLVAAVGAAVAGVLALRFLFVALSEVDLEHPEENFDPFDVT